ncbi:hypothetical protein [Altererythrobacter fulvus]|uniref:beta strand repeat-containing protein n=1 Tax=Caenibius fulvus TaxID=2126012 RepID=UPI003015B4F4
MNKSTNRGRINYMVSVGTAMAASLIVTGAQAAETTISPTLPGPLTTDTDANAHDVVDAVLSNVATVSSQIVDTRGGVVETETPITTSDLLVDGNDVQAVARANNFVNSIDLSVIEIDFNADGAAALGFETNFSSVIAEASGNAIRAELDDFQDGSVTVTDNRIAASASGNIGSTSLSGEIPNDYASGTAGSSTLTAGVAADWLDATGSLVASTVQLQIDPQVLADAGADSRNNIYLDLASTGDNTVSADLVVSDNLIGSTAKGNVSTSLIAVQAGGAPIFTGSAVVTNGQINNDTGGTGSIEATTQGSIYSTIGTSSVGATNLLTGSMLVSDNTVSASATGNEALGDGVAGNRIVLDDGMSFQGAGSSGAAVDTVYSGVTLTSTVAADLVIHNSQGNNGTGDSARTDILASNINPIVSTWVQAIENGSVSVSGNDALATARGNTASSAFQSGEGAASFSGTVAVASQQTNVHTDVTAQVVASTLSADVAYYGQGSLPGSDVTVDGNRSAASAYGNQVSQLLSLAATDIDAPLTGVVLTGGTGPDGNLSADGNALVTSLQSQYTADVVADQEGFVFINYSADSADNSSLAATGNVLEAVALGNSGSNAASVAGTDLATGAGVANVQIIADNSAVSASSDGEVWIAGYSVNTSDLELTGNLGRAIAYGNSVGNSLSVEGEVLEVSSDESQLGSLVTLDTGATDGFVFDNSVLPVVDAAYGLLNDQASSAAISAQAFGYVGTDAAFGIYVDNVSGSSLATDENVLVGAAYGNDATNAASLAAGNLTASEGAIGGEPDFATVMNVTSVQALGTASTITVQVGGFNTVETQIGFYSGGGVSTSSVSTSDNAVQALAYGNRATNSVAVEATNIDTEADSFPGGTRGEASVLGGEARTDASFGLNNAQSARGTIDVSLIDASGSSPVRVMTEVANEVTESSVVSNGNTIMSGATANRADNLVDLSANGLATTGALTNYQIADADITSSIGVAEQTLDYWTTLSILPCAPDLCVNPGSAYDVVSISRLSPEEYDYLLANGWFVSGTELRRENTSVPSVITVAEGAEFDAAFLSYVLGGPGFQLDYIAPFADPGGVTVSVAENVSYSTIAVDGNAISGSVTGNSANNTVTAEGTDVPDGSDHFATWATTDGASTTALGDYMLANSQIVGDRDLTSLVYGRFSIEVADSADIWETTLSVDDNSQASRAVANTVSNSLELDAVNTAAGAALVSNQDSAADVVAVSNLDVTAPGAATASSISMSGNSNLALATINNASNSVVVSATNAGPVTFARDVLLDADTDEVAVGDHVLLNRQLASNVVTATAVTSVHNGDTLPGFDSIDLSSVTVTGNATSAEASGNRAFNSMDIEGTASLGASAGMLNVQASTATVSASGTMSAGIVLNGNDPVVAALQTSSISLGENTTSVLARGNAANNVLNYSAGAGYGDVSFFGTSGSSIAAGSDVDAVVTARAAILNVQSNSGDGVSATSTDASYLVAFNVDLDFAAMANASVGVIGNSVQAAAYGNTASNLLTVTALNTGMPTAAIGNSQTNSASVVASVTTVTVGIQSGVGAITGSSLSVTGNTVSATAIGNNAASAITAGF